MLIQKKSRIRKKNLILILVLLIILISGCTDRQSLSNPQGNSVEVHETDANSDIKQESICKNIENEVWMKRCLAYEEKNPTYCEFFDTGSSSSKTEIDNCYYDISLHSEIDACSEISDTFKKWSCMAIVKKDPNQCDYSGSFDCFTTYAKYYNDKTACEMIDDSNAKATCLNSLNFIEESQKRTKEETIIQVYQEEGWEAFSNQDCSIYVDDNEKGICLKSQSIQNRDSQKCLLITSNRREPCIIALALLNEDLNLCKELESNRQIACIKPYAHFNDINACLDLNKLNKNECILYAVSNQNTNQKIEPQICEEIIKDENKKARCYLEYLKSKLISQ